MEAIAHAWERIDPQTDSSRIVALHEALLSFSTAAASKVEAHAPLPGLGEPRIQAAVANFNRSKAAKCLLVAGAHRKELTCEVVTIESLRRDGLRLSKNKAVLIEKHTENTAEQIIWVMEWAKALGVKSLALYTSPYHLLRAYATAIKAMAKLQMEWIPIVPVSTGWLLNPVPEYAAMGVHKTGADMVPGELDRFNGRYPEDVATYGETMEYLRWLGREHPEIAEAR